MSDTQVCRDCDDYNQAYDYCSVRKDYVEADETHDCWRDKPASRKKLRMKKYGNGTWG